MQQVEYTRNRQYHPSHRRRSRSNHRLFGLVGFVAILSGAALVMSTFGKGNASPPITAGDSKAHCVTLSFPHGVLSQSEINKASSLTGITYNCISTFANPAPTWSAWVAPWMFSITSDGWDSWLASSSEHQVVMGMDLIPQSLSNTNNPLAWERACAAGSYNRYAETLAANLVSYGAGSVVIRLGLEANGGWEADYVGSTATEMRDWAKCFDNEVTAMRAVPSSHFLIVWDPNACTTDLPLSEWYPGNAYVDIMGIDAYDEDCSTRQTVAQEGWPAYMTDSVSNPGDDPNFPSIADMSAFAAAHGKPLSLPEWGINSGTSDDARYVSGMTQLFNNGDFSFESYFDTDTDGIAALGSAIPNATGIYEQAFAGS